MEEETERADRPNIFIEVSNLKLYSYHGVSEQEKRVGNMFEVSCRVSYPAYEAVKSDELSKTINYAEIVEIIKKEMSVTSNLIEHVAGRIRLSLLKSYPLISKGVITVSKLNPPCGEEIEKASVVIEW